MPTLPQLFEKNQEWVHRTLGLDPDFFTKLSEQQTPKYLWIGCSDSRVPANQITGLMPGEVFVHRNIANMVVHTDLNLLSVVQFAVDILKVEHIMVVGHYGCGGIRAALDNKSYGLLDNWLRHIQDVANRYATELDPLDDDSKRDRLCELNIIVQADNLRRTSVLQDAWARGQSVEIHSWIYRLKDGLLKHVQGVITGPVEKQVG